MNLYGIYQSIRYWFLERPRGLDFSLPDRTYIKTSPTSNYYSRTDANTLNQLCQFLSVSSLNAMLDIGCGKGAALYRFSQLGFGRVVGIEKFKPLAEIAENNMRRLGVSNVEVICCDALDFSAYQDFDYFFLFNPFKFEIAIQVLQKIKNSLTLRSRVVKVISVQNFYNPLLEEMGFQFEHKIVSRLTGVGTYIFTFNEGNA